MATLVCHGCLACLQLQTCCKHVQSTAAQRKKGVELQQEALTEAGIPVTLLAHEFASCTETTRCSLCGFDPPGILAQPPDDPSQKLPISLLRRYEVFIKPRNSMKPLKMRDIKATSIGHLVTLQVRDVPSACCWAACTMVWVSKQRYDAESWSRKAAARLRLQAVLSQIIVLCTD